MKNVLVFGASGFLGSFLVKYLLSNNIRVIAFIRTRYGMLENVKNDNLIYVDKIDTDYLLEQNIVCIYNLASQQPSKESTYEELYSNNVVFNNKVISLAKKLNVDQFIYTSTTTVYDTLNDNTLLSEKSCINPSNYYGLTKYISENIIKQEFKNSVTKVSIVRFPSIFGANNGGIIETLYSSAKESKDIELFSRGERYRNLVYVDSAIEVLYLLLNKKSLLSNHEIFLAGSYDSLKLIDIACLIVKLLDSESKIVPVDKFPPVDLDIKVDISKTITKLGYNPLSIEEGLKKYIKVKRNEEI